MERPKKEYHKVPSSKRIERVGLPKSYASKLQKIYDRIDNANWPPTLVRAVIFEITRVAFDPLEAHKLARKGTTLSQEKIVLFYAQTLYKEFNRFLVSKTIDDFMVKRKLPKTNAEDLKREQALAKKMYGTRKDLYYDIKYDLARHTNIDPKKRKEVRDYLEKHMSTLSIIELHRIKHYIVGLVFEKATRIKRKVK